MEHLKTKRRVIKGSITRIHGFCLDSNASIEDIKVRVDRLEELVAQYESIQNEIDLLITDSAQQGTEDLGRDEVESKYFAAKAAYLSRLHEQAAEQTVVENESPSDVAQAIQAMANSQSSIGLLLERLTTDQRFQSSPVNVSTLSNPQQEPRLPQIQIPEFDGTYTEWIRFHDLFEALIHTRSTVSAVEKLEYLQTKLKGEALSLIKHLKPTNDNYLVAWKILNDKYDKSENVKRAYLELLFDQPSMKAASADETKRVYNNTNESLNALEVLKEPVQHWNTIIIFHLERKLDAETQVLWCREKRMAVDVKVELFLKFLEGRIYELESCQRSSAKLSLKTAISNRPRNQSLAYSSSSQNCVCCDGAHFLYQCEKFKDLTVDERFKVVRQHNLCFNCLRTNHLALNCKSSLCRVCGSKHNSLLHFTSKESDEQQKIFAQASNLAQSVAAQNSTFSVNSLNQTSEFRTILPTAIVMVRDEYSQLQPCRALLDSGAQATLISETCLQRLGLARIYDKTLMFGVGPNRGTYTKGKVNLEIVSSILERTIKTQAYCLPTLTKNLPTHNIESQKFKHFSNLKLADPRFNKCAQIDIIMGADIFSCCILPDKIQHPSGSPTAINTIFGWVIMGSVEIPIKQNIFAAHAMIDLDQNLKRFWEIEDVSSAEKIISDEERAAEIHYQQNYKKMENGRYMVRLPFKDDKVQLGESKTAALKIMKSMENRFTHKPNLRQEYANFMHEYLELKHMELEDHANEIDGYFMPHHAVLKPSSTTTRLRVVFDASCHTSNGKSLNENLLVGPTIQNDLFTILLKFRKFEIGMSADIEKMYRQVIIHPDDRRFQRILWRDTTNEAVNEYHLNTVTYGIASAPFLAIRTLHQIALDNASSSPTVAEAINEQFYVDDFMSCAENIQVATQLKDGICSVLRNAGFNLRKWSSNSKAFLQSIDPPDKDICIETVIDTTNTVKTLGLLWDTSTDTFKYSLDLKPITATVTKRSVLSDVAKIFDPIGLLAPVIVPMKILLQKLWLHGLDWDDQLPEHLLKQWRMLRDNINRISELRILRWIKFENGKNIELHGFSDSSELAYAAVVYLKVIYADGRIYTTLITAKTRVAPVKQVSLPRLELCGAHLLVKLMIKVQKAMNIGKCELFGWTDSTVVLAWLSDHPVRWKSFVANRTSFIIHNMPSHQWSHISSRNNPADLATRGLSATDLVNNKLWWHGPKELLLPRKQHIYISPPTGINMEEKRKIVCHISTERPHDIFDLYSSYNKLLRITALILRFRNNCMALKTNRKNYFLSTLELRDASYQLVKAAQQQTYPQELRTLSANKQFTKNNKLTTLNPFIDERGIMRVGGRIENARISYDQKHPMILERNHKLTELLVSHYHLRYLHSGHRQTMYFIGLKYWIPYVTSIVKRCIYKCVTCMRFRAIPYSQQMGILPHYRLQQTSAFINTGVDFAGPIQVRSWKGRGSKLYKTWIAIFICLTTKAIHLELVTELSTAAFIASLRRFVSRRGKPSHIYSDNGTNFVGCNQQLRELYQYLNEDTTQNELQREMCDQQIQWHFSPPFAPHFGGMWEAGVKSTKYHLKRVLADSSVTFEEMYTVLCQIEACLNSRPLCIKFEGDLDPLTPAHFLILRPMTSIPDEDLSKVKISHCDRWQHLQKIVQSFWKKWSIQYLSEMQQRSKWSQKLANLQINDLVIIKDDKLPPTHWSIAKVTDIHPGSDGLVRVVTVRTSRGLFKRPIAKLCPLFLDV